MARAKHVEAELLMVVEPCRDAPQIADAETVRASERARLDLIDDRPSATIGCVRASQEYGQALLPERAHAVPTTPTEHGCDRATLPSWRPMATDELAAFYRRYNACCNEHRFEDLREFVARHVVINGTEGGLDAYADGL